MINISQLLTLAQRIQDTTGVAHHIWVTTESELSKHINGIRGDQFPLLVVVTPSYDADAINADNVMDVNQMIFFVLKRDKFQSANQANNIADMDATLEIVTAIKNFLLNGFPDFQDCTLVNGVAPDSFHIDPEFNYLGCNGWSMSFQIKTR